MASSNLRSAFSHLGGGEGACMLQRTVVHLDAAAADYQMPVQMRYVENVVITPVTVTQGTPPDADQRLYVDMTTDSQGGFAVPSTGKIKLSQAGASPVAMRYTVLVFGR
jgi:hypothetical protein